MSNSLQQSTATSHLSATASGTTREAASATPEADSRKRPAPDDTAVQRMPTKKTKVKAQSYVCTPTVNILVGSKNRCFGVHEGLLLSESSNLASRISRSDGSSTKELKLPEASEAAMEVLVDYLYHDSFALSATWEETTNLDGFVHAWMLADELDMEDAKNAIMDRLRFTVDKANTHEIEGTSDAALIRDAVAVMQSMIPQPKRWCPLYTFLVHRLARDLNKGLPIFEVAGPNYREPAFQEILRNGGDMVVDIVSECFSAKLPTRKGPQPDPASLRGCHFHEHTSGRGSRVCAVANVPHTAVVMPHVSTPKVESNTSTNSTLLSSKAHHPPLTFGTPAAPQHGDIFRPCSSLFGHVLNAGAATNMTPNMQTTQIKAFGTFNPQPKPFGSFGSGDKL